LLHPKAKIDTTSDEEIKATSKYKAPLFWGSRPSQPLWKKYHSVSLISSSETCMGIHRKDIYQDLQINSRRSDARK